MKRSPFRLIASLNDFVNRRTCRQVQRATKLAPQLAARCGRLKGRSKLPKGMVDDLAVIGVVGGLHYEGQTAADVVVPIEFLASRNPQLVALSPHDSSLEAIEAFRVAFPQAYQDQASPVCTDPGCIWLWPSRTRHR